MIIKILFFLLFIFVINISDSLEIVNSKIGYLVDIPEEWIIVDESNTSIVTFSDKTRNAVFQIFCFKRETFITTQDIVEYIKVSFNPKELEYDPYFYNNVPALFGYLSFNTKSFFVKGYFIGIKGKEYNYILLSVANNEYFNYFKDFLFSCLDSFAFTEKEKLCSGPVSQYYYGNGGKKNSINLNIGNKIVNFVYYENEREIAEIVVEREARILASVKNEYYYAWQRYYRIIYRDNYQRIKKFSELLKENSITDINVLIKWIQNFYYERKGSISDFTSPIELIISKKGDCDSRVLLLSEILDFLNIDSIIVVSPYYKHALIGVDIKINGRRINFDGKDYLLVELTKIADPGVIDENILNFDYWFPIKIK